MSRLPEWPMKGARPFTPRVSSFSRPFWEGLEQGELRTTRCAACGVAGFPPRNLCRGCWSRDVRWVTLAPRGRLYSFTRVHVAPAAFREDVPYAIGLVDLEDGVRLMCRLIGEVGAQDLECAVEMLVLRYEDGPLFGARVIRPGP